MTRDCDGVRSREREPNNNEARWRSTPRYDRSIDRSVYYNATLSINLEAYMRWRSSLAHYIYTLLKCERERGREGACVQDDADEEGSSLEQWRVLARGRRRVRRRRHQRRVDHRRRRLGHHTSDDGVLGRGVLAHSTPSLGERELNASRLERARRLGRDVVGGLEAGLHDGALELEHLGHRVAAAHTGNEQAAGVGIVAQRLVEGDLGEQEHLLELGLRYSTMQQDRQLSRELQLRRTCRDWDRVDRDLLHDVGHGCE